MLEKGYFLNDNAYDYQEELERLPYISQNSSKSIVSISPRKPFNKRQERVDLSILEEEKSDFDPFDTINDIEQFEDQVK